MLYFGNMKWFTKLFSYTEIVSEWKVYSGFSPLMGFPNGVTTIFDPLCQYFLANTLTHTHTHTNTHTHMHTHTHTHTHTITRWVLIMDIAKNLGYWLSVCVLISCTYNYKRQLWLRTNFGFIWNNIRSISSFTRIAISLSTIVLKKIIPRLKRALIHKLSANLEYFLASQALDIIVQIQIRMSLIHHYPTSISFTVF